jgi:hypothetical protein
MVFMKESPDVQWKKLGETPSKYPVAIPPCYVWAVQQIADVRFTMTEMGGERTAIKLPIEPLVREAQSQLIAGIRLSSQATDSDLAPMRE